MLKLGDKNIKKLKFGDKSIFKAIYNGKTVYRDHPVFLDYITCDKRCWIDTGIVPTLEAEIEFVYSSTHKESWYFGCRGRGLGTGIGAGYLYGTYIFFGTKSQKATADVDLLTSGNKNTLVLNKDSLIVNGQDYSDYANFGTDLASSNLTLFTMNSTTEKDTRGFLGNCYEFKVKENGVVIQDLRPCLDPCNVVCFYDLVSGKYFYNQGTGTLKAGGRFVESIIFDGNSWIDTGKYANQNIEINTTFKHNTLERAIYGVRDGNNNCTGYVSVFGAWRFGSNNANYKTEADVVYNVVQNREGIDINGKYTAYTNTTSEFTSSYTILLGKQNNTTFNPFKGEINVFRIKESGVDIQDLRPLVDENGVACFVDLVTGKRFYNQGTGKLKYKDFERLPYLDFDGASYIDTGVKGRSGISVNYDVYIPKTNIDTGLVFPTGSRNSGDGRFYLGVVIYGYGKCWGISIGYDSYNQSQKPSGDKYYSIIANTSNAGAELIVDGESIVTTTAKVTTDYNIYVGGANNYGTPQLTGTNGLRFKHYTMYEDGTLKRQYIPVRRSDNVICFYDFAEGKYYEKVVA